MSHGHVQPGVSYCCPPRIVYVLAIALLLALPMVLFLVWSLLILKQVMQRVRDRRVSYCFLHGFAYVIAIALLLLLLMLLF